MIGISCTVKFLPSRCLKKTVLSTISLIVYGGGWTAGVTDRVKNIVSPYLNVSHDYLSRGNSLTSSIWKVERVAFTAKQVRKEAITYF